MANDVTTRSAALPASLGALAEGLRRAQTNRPSFGGGNYLRFKAGRWRLGDAPCNGRVLLVNPLTMQHGWVCWTDKPASAREPNEKLGEEMVSIAKNLPDKNTLPDLGWDWSYQVSFQGRFVDGGKETATYTASSHGGGEAFTNLTDLVLERLTSSGAAAAAAPCPMVELSETSYDHKQWGETFKPVFAPVGWASLDGEAADEEPDEIPDEIPVDDAPPPRRTRATAEDVPAPRRRAAAAAEPEDAEEDTPEPEAAAPRRRRRVSA